MDPNYSLPPNVALITLEVDQMQHKFLFLSLSLSLINLNVFQELDGGIVLLRLAHLYEVNIWKLPSEISDAPIQYTFS
jgi:hypothetical protein